MSEQRKAKVLYNIAMPIEIPNSGGKAQWTNVGVIVQTAKGTLLGKINYAPMPITSWNGKFSIFPVGSAKEKKEDNFHDPIDEDPGL